MKHIFVTGTDTEIGKTKVAQLLLQSIPIEYSTLGWKPIAAGLEKNKQGEWVNEDAVSLQQVSRPMPRYQEVNPIALKSAIAPHIAADSIQLSLSSDLVEQHFQHKPIRDITVIEGAGGWLLPLNNQETLADWVQTRQLPVILVVGMRLGALNHSLLTYQNICSRGLTVAGWVANTPHSTPMSHYKENLSYLQQQLDCPLLAEIPYFQSLEQEQAWLKEHSHDFHSLWS